VRTHVKIHAVAKPYEKEETCHEKLFMIFKIQAHGDFYTCREFFSRKQISNSDGFR